VQDVRLRLVRGEARDCREELTPAPGLDAEPTQGPLIDDRAGRKKSRATSPTRRRRARPCSSAASGTRSAGRFFEPTILTEVTPQMAVAREETFGPVAPLFRFRDETDAIALANDTEFGLAAYFYGRDIGRIWRVAEALEYGIVGINTGLISTEVAPFGGVKESGLGREGSKYGLEEFLEIKYPLLGRDLATLPSFRSSLAAALKGRPTLRAGRRFLFGVSGSFSSPPSAMSAIWCATCSCVSRPFCRNQRGSQRIVPISPNVATVGSTLRRRPAVAARAGCRARDRSTHASALRPACGCPAAGPHFVDELRDGAAPCVAMLAWRITSWRRRSSGSRMPRTCRSRRRARGRARRP
jgi:hypothetical protein